MNVYVVWYPGWSNIVFRKRDIDDNFIGYCGFFFSFFGMDKKNGVK